MKRIGCLWLCLTVLALCVSPALAAETAYALDPVYGRLTLDNDWFTKVLTPATLETNQEWLTSQGTTLEDAKLRYEEEGILLEAFDPENSRTLVVTAVQDVNAEEIYDVNAVDEGTRRDYRLNHSKDVFYGIQGYHYESATWKNFGGNLGRFLQLKYTLSRNGSLVMRGYQRRTVRNGYTITFDLQVTGRSAKDGDAKFVDKIVNRFIFTEIKNAPEGACRLTFTDEPPREVTSETLTISGKTEANATVNATLISMTDSKTATFSDTANKSGKYSIKLQFPQQGTFTLTVVATTEDGRTAQKTASIMYQRDYIPINLNTTIPTTLSSNTLEISGTTANGATTQLSVTGPVNVHKTKTGRSFSFTVNTKQEGAYQILLTVSKPGMTPRSITFNATRTLTEAERMDRIKSGATSLKYSALKNSIARYAGKTIVMSGYVMEVVPSNTEWVVKLAINRKNGVYQDFIFVVCRTDPQLGVESHVKMYGTLSENKYVEVTESGQTLEYPRFELLLFEQI